MRCRVGDLAFVVRSVAGNEGKVVTCVEYVGDREFITRGNGVRRDVDVWRIDPPLVAWNGRPCHYVADERLRPIRPEPGQDETIAWAGRPQELPIECITALREMS